MPTTKTKTKKAKAKKKDVKKSSSKKGSVSKKEKRDLVYAEGMYCFWVNGGPVLCSLLDLEEALNSMPEDRYEYHAKGEQNDFAEWVECVLNDGDCAMLLRKAKKRATAHKALKRHLKIYVF